MNVADKKNDTKKFLRYAMIITNQPYYGQHIKECFYFCKDKLQKSFACLVPTYVLEEDWFRDDFLQTGKICTLKPKKRYQFDQID